MCIALGFPSIRITFIRSLKMKFITLYFVYIPFIDFDFNVITIFTLLAFILSIIAHINTIVNKRMLLGGN